MTIIQEVKWEGKKHGKNYNVVVSSGRGGQGLRLQIPDKKGRLNMLPAYFIGGIDKRTDYKDYEAWALDTLQKNIDISISKKKDHLKKADDYEEQTKEYQSFL